MKQAELVDTLHRELDERRARLEAAIAGVSGAPDLVRLLTEVDDAIRRLDTTGFGDCLICGDRIDEAQLHETPLARYCLCDLTPERQAALQHDLDTAWKIQAGLLPEQNLSFAGWDTHFRYVPAGPVSGDYCDLVTRNEPREMLHFLLGDAVGHGVSAALLMSHLNASFRSVVDLGLTTERLVQRVNALFTQSTRPGQYATLVYGRADAKGEIEICNAGHYPPLLLRGDEATPVEASSFPVGLFTDSPYRVRRVPLDPGDTLFLYSDGIIESQNGANEDYGIERLSRVLENNQHRTPAVLAAACLDDAGRFRGSRLQEDDITLLVVRRSR